MIAEPTPFKNDVSCQISTLPPNTDAEKMTPKYKLLSIKRKCLNDAFNLKKFDRCVRFEAAELEDLPIIHQFLLNEFGKQETLNRALDMKVEDLNQPLNQQIKNAVPCKLTIMAIDENELCGLIVNTISTVNRDLMKEPKVKADYSKELDAESELSPKIRKIYTILDEMATFVPNFIPDCSKYLCINIINVRPEFTGCGLGKQLLIESFKLGKEYGIKYAEATCTAIASTKLCQSLGMRCVFEFLYNQYTYCETLVFDREMHDGCRSASLMIGNLDEINALLS